MEFRDVVRRRRMVRRYRDEPVDREVLDRIVAIARRAPSAGFTQGQHFIVITDPESRRRLAQLADEEVYVAQGLPPWISTAPVHVVVCAHEAAYHDRYREPDKLQDDGTEIGWPVPYWLVDAGASMMVLLLAAVDEGLGAGFFGFHRMPGLKEFLGIPDGVHPIGAITLGHPAPDQPTGSSVRGWKALDEVVHHDRW